MQEGIKPPPLHPEEGEQGYDLMYTSNSIYCVFARYYQKIYLPKKHQPSHIKKHNQTFTYDNIERYR